MPYVDKVTDPATWYLGPPGNMWPLFCPEPGVSISSVRYGGIHQGMSGKRTLDIMGYQYEYKMKFSYLTQEDFEWMEMLHMRAVPGPFKLLNPLKKNRLSQQASLMQVTPGDNDGVSTSGIVHTKMVRDWPEEASKYGSHSLQAFGWGAAPNGVLFDYALDNKSGVPILEDEWTFLSVFVKHISGDPTFELEADFYGADGEHLGYFDSLFEARSNWSRHYIGVAPSDIPDGAVLMSFALYNRSTDSVFNIAAAQVEPDQLTKWEVGGGAPTVIMNQLPLKSPRFPLRNAQMTLLEA